MNAARVNATELIPRAITMIVCSRSYGSSSGWTSPSPTPEMITMTWKNASA